MNDITDEIQDSLSQLLKRTNEEFGVTLSGNPISKDTIEGLHRLVHELHA